MRPASSIASAAVFAVALAIALPASALGVSSDSVRDAKKRRMPSDAVSAPNAVSDADAEKRAPQDYLQFCSGCHGVDGMGKPMRGIPRFTGQIGHFQRTAEGRAFVMQVPGLLGAGLTDARAAAVSNYIARRFGGTSLPPDFVPYTPDEARQHRETRPVDIMGKRDQLYTQLLELGFHVE
jgi:cytochrome c553